MSVRARFFYVGLLAAVVTTLTIRPAAADEEPATSTPASPMSSSPISPPPRADAPEEIAPRPWLAQPSSKSPPLAEGPGLSAWRVVLLLLAAASLGGGALYARNRQRRTLPKGVASNLRVLSSVRVGPKAHLVLTAVGNRVLLLGVTDDSIRRLGYFPAEDAMATPSADPLAPENPAAKVPSVRPFAHVLRAAWGTKARTATNAEGPGLSGGMSAADLIAEQSPPDEVLWKRDRATSAGGPAPSIASRTTARDRSAEAPTEEQASGLTRRRPRKPA